MDIYPCDICAQAGGCNIRLAFERFGQANSEMKSISFSCRRFNPGKTAESGILQARKSSCNGCYKVDKCQMRRDLARLLADYDNSISLVAFVCASKLDALAAFLEKCLKCERTDCSIRSALNFGLACSHHPDKITH
jgi:hypothetical protein